MVTMIKENLALINYLIVMHHRYIFTGTPAGNVPGSKNLIISCEWLPEFFFYRNVTTVSHTLAPLSGGCHICTENPTVSDMVDNRGRYIRHLLDSTS